MGRSVSRRLTKPTTVATSASARQAKPTTALHDDGPSDIAISRHPMTSRVTGDLNILKLTFFFLSGDYQ